MSRENSGGDRSDIPAYNTTLDREMESFDKLDPRIREFIRQLPMNFSAEQALNMQRDLGVEELLRTGQEMLEENFPGWRPI